jgi:hypothetical protein
MATENFLNKPMLAYLWAQLKARMVLAEVGKGLSVNDFTTVLKSGLESLINNDAGYQTSEEVSSAISTAITQAMANVLSEEEIQTLIDTAIAGFDHEVFVVASVLPDPEDANPNKIYLVPSASGTGQDEWHLNETGDGFDLFGTTEVDLSGYWNESNLQPMTESEILEILDAE